CAYSGSWNAYFFDSW
nr:immunoglobulin heavy chain junction region [Macaca mulatta]